MPDRSRRHVLGPLRDLSSPCLVCGRRFTIFFSPGEDVTCPGPPKPRVKSPCTCGVDSVGGGIHSTWCDKT